MCKVITEMNRNFMTVGERKSVKVSVYRKRSCTSLYILRFELKILHAAATKRRECKIMPT